MLQPTALLRFAGLLLLVLLPGACSRLDLSGDRQATLQKHLERAKGLYEARDYQGAVAAYEELLRFEPQHSDAHFQIGLIYDRNLNDHLNAAYHYQRYVQAPGADSGKIGLARGFLENAKLQLAASIPHAGNQGSPELVRLRSENAALHRQVDELKREMVGLRAKSLQTARVEEPKPPAPSTLTPPIEPKPQAPSRTWTVRKGDGIQAIAEKVYGDRSKWRDIVAANPKITDPNVLTPGQVLVLP